MKKQPCWTSSHSKDSLLKAAFYIHICNSFPCWAARTRKSSKNGKQEAEGGRMKSGWSSPKLRPFTFLWKLSVFFLVFVLLCSPLFITILKLMTGWVGWGGRDPMCRSGFGLIWGGRGLTGRGWGCLWGSTQISVSSSAFCLAPSSSSPLPLWNLRKRRNKWFKDHKVASLELGWLDIDQLSYIYTDS